MLQWLHWNGPASQFLAPPEYAVLPHKRGFPLYPFYYKSPDELYRHIRCFPNFQSAWNLVFLQQLLTVDIYRSLNANLDLLLNASGKYSFSIKPSHRVSFSQAPSL